MHDAGVRHQNEGVEDFSAIHPLMVRVTHITQTGISVGPFNSAVVALCDFSFGSIFITHHLITFFLLRLEAVFFIVPSLYVMLIHENTMYQKLILPSFLDTSH